MNRAWIFALLVAGACSHSQPAAAPTSPGAASGGGAAAAAGGGVSCEQASGHVMDLLVAGKQDVPPDKVKGFHDIFAKHCQADAWSADVRSCLANSKSLDDADGCAQNMTDQQRSALDADAGGPSGAPPPAPVASPPPGAAPAPAPASTTRGPVQRSGGDPCEGGK